MIRIQTTYQILRSSISRSVKVGHLKNSFMSGDRNIIGFLGEAAFQEHFPSAKFIDCYDYDFKYKNHRIDIKSRIARAEIKKDFDFTLPCLKKDQKCDFFVFAAIYDHFRFIDLLGWVKYPDFLIRATKITAGQEMPQGGHYKSDGLRILVQDLNSFTKLSGLNSFVFSLTIHTFVFSIGA